MAQDVISRKNQRKIDHIRQLRERGMSLTEARNKGLHFMKMRPEHLQIAFDGTLYERTGGTGPRPGAGRR